MAIMVLHAKDVMENDFISLRGSVSVLEAAKQMNARGHGFVIVSSADGQPQGIVTEWDLVSRLIAAEKNPATVTLAEIMSKGLISVGPDEGLESVSSLMAERGVRRIVVLQNGEIAGVITARIVLARMKEYIDQITTQMARFTTF